MAFINYRAKENSLKCDTCKFNFVNNYNYKVDDKGYLHFLDGNNNLEKVMKSTARGAMWAACKVCPYRKDFEKMYGMEPVKHFSAALD